LSGTKFPAGQLQYGVHSAKNIIHTDGNMTATTIEPSTDALIARPIARHSKNLDISLR